MWVSRCECSRSLNLLSKEEKTKNPLALSVWNGAKGKRKHYVLTPLFDKDITKFKAWREWKMRQMNAPFHKNKDAWKEEAIESRTSLWNWNFWLLNWDLILNAIQLLHACIVVSWPQVVWFWSSIPSSIPSMKPHDLNWTWITLALHLKLISIITFCYMAPYIWNEA